MRTKWYQKASITAAIITGIFLLLAAIIQIISPLLFEKKEKGEKEEKVFVIDHVEVEKIKNSQIDFIQMTFEEYYKKIDDLKDRFFEREEFIKKLKGKKIIWVGYVDRVYSDEDGSTGLTFSMVKDKTLHFALVDFDKNWKTKLFSLRKDDKIRVYAIFKEEKIRFPWLEGISLELLD